MNQVYQEISYYGLALILIPMLIVFGVNHYLRLFTINKKMAIGLVRAFVQLSLIGIVLTYIFKANSTYVNLAYYAFMLVVASYSSLSSTKLSIRKNIIPIFISMLIATFFMLIFFNMFVVKLNNVFQAQYFVILNGMMLGACLNGSVLAINRFYDSIVENEKKYYYGLCFSNNRLEALKPYFRESIVIVLKPSIANLEILGLVALPGTLTGQILAGSSPLSAVKYQIAIAFTMLRGVKKHSFSRFSHSLVVF